MFTIIGGDGKEYGPVTTEQVRNWITTGRASLDTKAKAAGSEEWRRLGDYAEFGGAGGLPPLVGAVAPSAASGASAGPGGRIGASLVNAVIYFLSLIPGGMMLSAEMFRRNPELARGGIPNMADFDFTGINVNRVYYGFAVVVIVQLILLATRGQTIGKLLTGVRVVRADDGAPAGFVRAGLLRFLLPTALLFLPGLLSILGVLFLLVDFCFIFSESGRCLHDLIAGTKVVRAK